MRVSNCRWAEPSFDVGEWLDIYCKILSSSISIILLLFLEAWDVPLSIDFWALGRPHRWARLPSCGMTDHFCHCLQAISSACDEAVQYLSSIYMGYTVLSYQILAENGFTETSSRGALLRETVVSKPTKSTSTATSNRFNMLSGFLGVNLAIRLFSMRYQDTPYCVVFEQCSSLAYFGKCLCSSQLAKWDGLTVECVTTFINTVCVAVRIGRMFMSHDVYTYRGILNCGVGSPMLSY